MPISNCFILSKEYPGLEKKKSNVNFEKSLTELQTHIDKLKTVYGNFNYAPVQTPLSKTKPFKFVSVIDGKYFVSYRNLHTYVYPYQISFSYYMKVYSED